MSRWKRFCRYIRVINAKEEIALLKSSSLSTDPVLIENELMKTILPIYSSD
jgi:hypothetical protein